MKYLLYAVLILYVGLAIFFLLSAQSASKLSTEPFITYCNDRCFQALIDRLDSIDGGKGRVWTCEDPFQAMQGLPVKYKTVETIGAETPRQLGYTHCKPF